MEAEIGAPLFVRNRRGVALTEVGKAFLAQSELLLEGARHAIESARSIAKGEIGSLRVGFTVSASFHPFVPRLIRHYRERYPGVSVRLSEHHTNELVESTEKGALDLAFIRAPADCPAGVTIEPIQSEKMLVVLPVQHPLSRRKSLRLADLADDTFILYPRSAGHAVYDAVVQACEAVGFSPTLGQEAPQLTSIVTLVAAGMGVSVLPSTMAQLRAEGVTYVPIAGPAPESLLAAAFRTQNPTPALGYMLTLMRQDLATQK
ncbi:LysR family transcriptional regulator [Cupriavidus sp. P-10]|nr:LysR family transcriptional regulator [Cupriavidus sp. P-10]